MSKVFSLGNMPGTDIWEPNSFPVRIFRGQNSRKVEIGWSPSFNNTLVDLIFVSEVNIQNLSLQSCLKVCGGECVNLCMCSSEQFGLYVPKKRYTWTFYCIFEPLGTKTTRNHLPCKPIKIGVKPCIISPIWANVNFIHPCSGYLTYSLTETLLKIYSDGIFYAQKTTHNYFFLNPFHYLCLGTLD